MTAQDGDRRHDDMHAEVHAFRERNGDVRSLDVIFADLCGIVRGKRYPMADLEKIVADGVGFPGSAFLLDTLGENHDPLGLGFSDGDPDAIARVIPGTIKRVPFAPRPLAQALTTFENPDGTPYYYDPRNVLARVLEPIRELGLTPVVAFELEFYLIDPERTAWEGPQPPVSPLTRQRDEATQVYGMSDVDTFDALLDEIAQACAEQGVPSGPISAEYAPGQFEINLDHVADPMAAADHCILFQRIVKGIARKHGYQATFMAKPYPQHAGSGMHMHLSLVDEAGRNVFDGGEAGPVGETLRHALGGILESLPEAMGILAPNINAYRRFQPNIYVPIGRSWGHENRSVALRIPQGKPQARRIEHRVAGADANPYLTLATVLAGIHHGIATKADPGPAHTGNAGAAFDTGMPWRPRRAFEALADAAILRRYFGGRYLDAYAACKLSEMDNFEAEPSPLEYRWYLHAE